MTAANIRWERATGVVPETPAHIRGWWGQFQCGPEIPNAAGCYKRSTDTLEIDVRSSNPELVAVHEVGHKLGAGHSDESGHVMTANLSASSGCITQDDIDQVCAVQICAWERPECP